MEKETLLTFNFNAPSQTSRVELIGSWDNFTNAYLMQHDRRRGPTHWTGCFRFSNIIFDGKSPYFSPPRDGGLKQGGRYWYYFRLDDSIEAYDEARDLTSVCPLLPGQTVNVLEVPVEAEQEVVRPRSDSGFFDIHEKMSLSFGYHYTLDPATKYEPLSPPMSRRRTRCSTYGGQDSNKIQSVTEELPTARSEPRILSRLLSRSGSKESSRTACSKSQPHAAAAESKIASRPPLCDEQDEDASGPQDDSASIVPPSSQHILDHHSNTTHTLEELFSDQASDHTTQHTAEPARRQPSRNAVPERNTDTIDISAKDMIDVWKATSRLHLRNMRGSDRCYQVSIPQELAWTTPRDPMTRSLHQLRGPIVS